MKTRVNKRGKTGYKKRTMKKRGVRPTGFFIADNINDRLRKQTSLTKRSDALSKFEREIVIVFLTFLNVIKLYHWNTYSYGEHKATDSLYEKMNGHIDKFIEVLLGKETGLHPLSGRINIDNMNISIPAIYTREKLAEYIEVFKSYLITLGDKDELEIIYNGDLFNIRDEIVSDLNEFLYLLTLE